MVTMGLAKENITPRVGAELTGYGAFLNRKSTWVRDRLWARALIIDNKSERIAIVSLDLLGVDLPLTRKIQNVISAKTGLKEKNIFLFCSHTHSGPACERYIGWGEADIPYLETLPFRIAIACEKALTNMFDGEISHAEVPCEGIGTNREHDAWSVAPEEALKDDWRPAKPETTDTTCHVFKITDNEGAFKGFISYFSCHPVVGGSKCFAIHGDYPGIATNMLERENPGSVGLFLQGCSGDINSCVVCQPEQQAMFALDVLASRYANAVRNGFDKCSKIKTDILQINTRELMFSRKNWTLEQLEKFYSEKYAELTALEYENGYADESNNTRQAAVFVVSLRQLIAKAKAGEPLGRRTEIFGIRLGDLTILGSGFEAMRAIKLDVLKNAKGKITLVCGTAQDMCGYAPDKVCAERGGYAADKVPIMGGDVPYANIHEELVNELSDIENMLNS